MISLKKKQTGFTIVELLIVIVVIGILAAIVITTFVGVQKRARDSERKSDLQALASQIEVYFADNSFYPSLGQMNDPVFRGDNLQGLKDEALDDPSDAAGPVLAATAPDAATGPLQYSYETTGCNAAGIECQGFTLTANLENDESPPVNHIVTGSNN